jgi:ribosome maturation factor RimP
MSFWRAASEGATVATEADWTGNKTGNKTQEERNHLYRDIPDEFRRLIEPIVVDQGCELVNVKIVRGGGPATLNVIVDNRTGDGRVAVERCAEISREIETHLDSSEIMSTGYRLEVSSPGLDRVLAREKDFAAACGSEVRIQTRRPLQGRRRFKGVLLEFSNGLASVQVDDGIAEIPFEEVEKANTVYQFSREDFSSRSAK